MGRTIYRVEALNAAYEPYGKRDYKTLEEAEETYQHYLAYEYSSLGDGSHVRLLKIEEIHGRA